MLGQLCRCGWVCPCCPRIPSKPERSRLCGQVHAQKLSKGHHGGAEQGLDPHVHLERGVGCLGKNRPLSAPAVGFGFEGTNSNLDSCGSCDTDVSQWDRRRWWCITNEVSAKFLWPLDFALCFCMGTESYQAWWGRIYLLACRPSAHLHDGYEVWHSDPCAARFQCCSHSGCWAILLQLGL